MNKTHRICLISSSCILLVLVIISCCFTGKTVDASAVLKEFTPTIVIDPGHGGEDGGAVADFDILEKDINLKISLLLKDYFLSNGFSVVMTRETDTALYDKDTKESYKQSDLKNRVEVFNSSSTNIVISIHQNKFSQNKYKGTQVFYSDNNEKSGLLAQNIQHSVVSLLQHDNEREPKVAGSEIYILDNTNTVAVLVECGFLSNSDDLINLTDEKYQKKLAYCIYLGFLEYYYTNY